MNLKLYLYGVLALALGGLWLTDRIKQFEHGKAECAKERAEAQADYDRRQKDKQQTEIERAVKEALEASKHIQGLHDIKTREVEKTRVIIKNNPVPMPCSASDEFVRDINETINSLQRK